MGSYIGVTISDLNGVYGRLCELSIKSFLNNCNTDVYLYIIGENELKLKDERIHIIKIPKTHYDISIDSKCVFAHPVFLDLIIEKLLLLCKYDNCIFFENDVFFNNNIVFENFNDGISYAGYNNFYRHNLNSGLIVIKNAKFDYSLNDIKTYFNSEKLDYPDERFLNYYITNKNIPHTILYNCYLLNPAISDACCSQQKYDVIHLNGEISAKRINCVQKIVKPFIKDIIKCAQVKLNQKYLRFQ